MTLKGDLSSTANIYQTIDIQSIYRLQQDEAKLQDVIEDLIPVINDSDAAQAMEDVRALIALLQENNHSLLNVLRASVDGPALKDLDMFIEVQPQVTTRPTVSQEEIDALSFFNRFYGYQLDSLTDFILRYENIR